MPPLLRALPAGRLPAAVFERFPGLTDRGYRWVAEHRSQLSRWLPSSAKRRARQRVHEREQDLRLAKIASVPPRRSSGTAAQQ